MKAFVVEVKSVIGNRVSNDDGVAAVYFTNAHADKLTYGAPIVGDYTRAFAFMAEDMPEAIKMAIEALSKSNGGEP